MLYTGTYHSPLGTLLLACSSEGLTGVWFEDQKYFAAGLAPEHVELDTEDLACTRQWLDVYFSGREPDFFPRLHLEGTPFQRTVWELLRHIPYGTLTTYGTLARDMARAMGRIHMSAQAVGSAVGHNPVSILVPCHRVVGTGGNLTGYAGGLDRKARLLALEGVDPERLRLPRNSSHKAQQPDSTS